MNSSLPDIFNACRNGDIVTVKTVYKSNAESIHAKDPKGYTPLILAAYNHQNEVVAFLLSKNVDVDAQDISGNTALMGAVFKGYLEAVQQLLQAGATIDKENYNHATALTFASTFNRHEIAQLLLEKGANPLHPDARGNTPIAHAKMQGNKKMEALMQSFIKK